jgi:hypothetical protein
MADQYPFLCSVCHDVLDYEDDGRGWGVMLIEPCQKCAKKVYQQGVFDEGNRREER